MNGAVLDLVTGAVIALLGVLVLARPTAAGVVLSRLLGRVNMGAPTRAGVLGRGVLFLVIGIALSGIGISFV